VKAVPALALGDVKSAIERLDGSKSRVALAAAVTTTQPATPDNGGSSGELWLYGLVGGWWSGFNASGVADALRGLDVDNLTVRIHSPGGSASDGVAIGNLLRNHRANVTVVVDGIAASAASVIAVAGDDVVMCPGSQMMLHDASTGMWGNAAELRRAADWIDGQSDNYAGVYAYKAGGTAAEWRTVMMANDGDGTYYTADAAVTAGLASEVGTRVAVGSPPVLDDEIDDIFDDEEMLARIAHDVELMANTVSASAQTAWNGLEPTPKPPSASAVGSITKGKRGSAVAYSDDTIASLRDKLGVAEDADDATLLAAVDDVLDKATEPPAKPTVSATAAVPEGMTLIESDVLENLREQGKQGVEARTQQLEEKRDTAILQAIKDGKITPARKDHWATSWNADAEGTEQLLAGLPAGIIPVAERGHDKQPINANSAYDELFGHEKKKES
jgi:ATP-dependent protease ClpP protease subunit